MKASDIQTFKFDNPKPPEENENEYPYQRLERGGHSGHILSIVKRILET